MPAAPRPRASAAGRWLRHDGNPHRYPDTPGAYPESKTNWYWSNGGLYDQAHVPGYTTTASYTKAPVGTLFEAQEPESFTGGFAGQPLVVQQNGQFARPRPGPMTQYPESFTGSSSSPYGRAMGMAPGQPIVIHADTNGYAPTARAPRRGQAALQAALP